MSQADYPRQADYPPYHRGCYLVLIDYSHDEVPEAGMRLPDDFERPRTIRLPVIPRVGDEYYCENAIFRVDRAILHSMPSDASKELVEACVDTPVATILVTHVGWR